MPLYPKARCLLEPFSPPLPLSDRPLKTALETLTPPFCADFCVHECNMTILAVDVVLCSAQAD